MKTKSKITEFQSLVYALVKSISRGSTMTYAQVASAIGRPNAMRAVGNALNRNSFDDVPCHRVIRSDGKIGGYNRGSDLKRKLLIKEKAIK